MAFFTQNKAKLCKHYENIGFWEKRHFFRRKLGKSQKIVIITSTPNPRTVWPKKRKDRSSKIATGRAPKTTYVVKAKILVR
jgi:hypothetical protein